MGSLYSHTCIYAACLAADLRFRSCLPLLARKRVWLQYPHAHATARACSRPAAQLAQQGGHVTAEVAQAPHPKHLVAAPHCHAHCAAWLRRAGASGATCRAS